MSKWQLPSQKGTELWPSATRSPTKLVIDGVEPGSDLAVEISKRFAGPINQFHQAQAQKYSLSTNQNQQGISARPGIKMQYQNLQGQETLRVKVDEEIIEQVKKEIKPPVPWDWVQVDISIPDNDGYLTSILAQIVRPPQLALTPGATLPWEGFAYADPYSDQYTSDGTEKPLIQFAGSPALPVNYSEVPAPSSAQIASLLIDLRTLHNYSEVRVDLYGNLDPRPNSFVRRPDPYKSYYAAYLNNSLEFGEYTLVGQPTAADFFDEYPEMSGYSYTQTSIVALPLWASSDPDSPASLYSQDVIHREFIGNAAGNYFNRLQSWNGSNWSSPSSVLIQDNWDRHQPPILGATTQLPSDSRFIGTVEWRFAVHANFGSTKTWYDGSTGPAVSYARLDTPPSPDQLDFPPPVDGSARGGALNVKFFHMPAYIFDSVPNPSARDATITARAFRGTPDWFSQEYLYEDPDFNLYYNRWEIATKFPDAVNLGVIAPAVTIVGRARSSNLTEYNNLDFLGSVYFYQKDGAVVWKPA